MSIPTEQEHPEAKGLSDPEIDEILLKPNGPFVLLELVRRGKIDPEKAVNAINQIKPPFLKRLGLAVLDTFFSR